MAETQFDRERMLLGDEAMQVLAASHVAVFGVGGVGSFAAEALARAGVGAITLIDHDTQFQCLLYSSFSVCGVIA